ncbi:hypothetical protein [uncultured Erythrobacter sp.]|uniref:hypothetical protein n=1 Tax=uncultured Erythrobacter sp. TaxID=263913 RepID=UPI002611BBD2|nr:hypothetical protein [uncultured Erythrobacter sp.]
MNFDMNTVWSRGVELVRDNFSLLVVIAGVFLLLPSVVMNMLFPDAAAMSGANADPDIAAQQMFAMLGSLFLWAVPLTLVQFAGYGTMVALIGADRPTVGEALVSGIKATPSMFVIFLLFILAYLIAAIVIMLPFGLIAGVLGAPWLIFVAFIPVLGFIFLLMGRLSVTMPALLFEGSLNPVKAMVRSFQMTATKQWQITLFWAVIFIVYFVISFLITGLIGVIAALISSSTTAALILGLVSGALAMVSGILICALSVAMHSQLSGPSVAAIEETFD